MRFKDIAIFLVWSSEDEGNDKRGKALFSDKFSTSRSKLRHEKLESWVRFEIKSRAMLDFQHGQMLMSAG